MKILVCACILVLAGLGVAQQQGGTAASVSLNSATSTFPPAAVQRQGIFPGRPIQPSDDFTPPEIRQLIRDGLSSEPALAGLALQVGSDDHSVVLSGVVASDMQHKLAIQIVEFYASNRAVVDKIKFR